MDPMPAENTRPQPPPQTPGHSQTRPKEAQNLAPEFSPQGPGGINGGLGRAGIT